MIIHRVSVLVHNVTPRDIWQWMAEMDEQRYLSWHPDHRRYAVLERSKRSNGLVGMKVFFDEVIDGDVRIASSWEVVMADEPRCIIFRALIPYPVRLELRLVEVTDGTMVTHLVLIGFKSWFASVFDLPILVTVFSKRRRELLERHVHEEFGNLEILARRPTVG